MWMYLYVYTYVFIYICIYMYAMIRGISGGQKRRVISGIYIGVYICECIYMCTHMYLYTYVYICMRWLEEPVVGRKDESLQVHLYMIIYIHIWICMYWCMHINICICMYMYAMIRGISGGQKRRVTSGTCKYVYMSTYIHFFRYI
jgi:hypothetical protein